MESVTGTGEDALPHQPADEETKRASARLPGLDIEIVHRRSPSANAEQISITLQAVPSFEAFGRFLEAANPFAFWAEAVQTAWFPWFEMMGALMLPWGAALAPPQLGPGVWPGSAYPRVTDALGRKQD